MTEPCLASLGFFWQKVQLKLFSSLLPLWQKKITFSAISEGGKHLS
jgi:hypothetical protein